MWGLRMKIRMAATVIVASTLIAGCGSSGPSEAERSAATSAKEKKEAAKAEAERKAETARLQAEQQELHDQCAETTDAFRAALQQLDSRLEVGLNYQDYSERVGDARVAYDTIDVDELQAISPTCLSSAAKLETAYNKFLQVQQIWDSCIDDYACDFSEGATNQKAQVGWVKAGTALRRSQSMLDAMAPRE